MDKFVIDWIGIIALQIICTGDIDSENRTVTAIGKHIVAQQTLPGRSVDIGTDETLQRGIVITTLEVVQSQLTNIVLAAVAISARFCTAGETANYAFSLYLIIRKSALICNTKPKRKQKIF